MKYNGYVVFLNFTFMYAENALRKFAEHIPNEETREKFLSAVDQIKFTTFASGIGRLCVAVEVERVLSEDTILLTLRNNFQRVYAKFFEVMSIENPISLSEGQSLPVDDAINTENLEYKKQLLLFQAHLQQSAITSPNSPTETQT